ncbi:GSCFA domain-containing protein [Polaribacter aestuariivivens]|uniref:GSCFA domain-containing protein n=1 Tax=Polaribacter aestuariivivens TaxID=2304626 RepID=A0A5S3NB06_9FLAO|nr:GSCFA domain-containing protein [Polaribacter aestuariivivens]TMM30076.1 GSCFA domain-containing protein [Polaribacter aestuariivivens]
MNLQTKIPIQKETRNEIDYSANVLLLGSCFSENIGNKFSYYKFQVTKNPFGILFHPKAIETFITNVINKKEYSIEDVVYQNERWHCFDSHSSLSTLDKNELLKNLNSIILSSEKNLTTASHIVITLGTSWVYRFIETDTIVANCHKIPQKKFLKELLTVSEVSENLDAIITLIRTVNKKAAIIFTVSPVRHLKDGFTENQLSKSHLIAGIHQIINPRNSTHYFPSFEIMMDELRDYRFYKEDMIHPNKTAIDYIWEKFLDTWFSEASKITMQEIEAIQKGISHKPFNENSDQHQQFLKNLETKKEKITQSFPFIEF